MDKNVPSIPLVFFFLNQMTEPYSISLFVSFGLKTNLALGLKLILSIGLSYGGLTDKLSPIEVEQAQTR
jgi:hypothetical protein